jgi:hypothetical protein
MKKDRFSRRADFLSHTFICHLLFRNKGCSGRSEFEVSSPPFLQMTVNAVTPHLVG